MQSSYKQSLTTTLKKHGRQRVRKTRSSLCNILFSSRATYPKISNSAQRKRKQSDRNAQTIVSVVFNSKVGKLVKDCTTPQGVVDVLAANELDSVSKLKRFIAEPVDKVAKLLEAIANLEQDERDSFAIGYAELAAE